MSTRWFRIPYARNAFLRLLSEDGLDLESLSIMHGIRAMTGFASAYRPQHAERDLLEAEWSPTVEGYEVRLVRRMQRHGQAESCLVLAFGYAAQVDRTEAGSAPFSTWREAAALAGYRAVRGARPRYRRLDQS